MTAFIAGSTTTVNINTIGEELILNLGVAIDSDANGINVATGATGNTFNISGSIATQSGFNAVVFDAADTHFIVDKSGFIFSGQSGIIQTSTDVTDIVNNGSIFAESLGISSAGLSGKIINNGTISAAFEAIALGSAPTRTNFTIENYGTLIGNYGISVGSGDVTILLGKTSVIKSSETSIESGSDTGDIVTVVNRGFISTTGDRAYWGDDGLDIFTNFGTVAGDIDLGGGNDVFRDKAGKITGAVLGGTGDDTYYMRSIKTDIFEVNGEGSADKVISSKSYSLLLDGEIEQLVLIGKANVNATGGDTSNLITGNRGKNVIAGGYGEDFLTGGKGNDIFVFRATNQHDTITDFEQGKDHIKIDGFTTFDSFKDIKSHIIQVGDDVVIDLQSEVNGDFLTIENAKVKDFDKGDFQF